MSILTSSISLGRAYRSNVGTLFLGICIVLSGCGRHYLHFRDGTALECEEAAYSEDLSGWLVQLPESGAVILVDGDRVRTERPLTGSPEGDRLLDGTDPGDTRTAIKTHSSELLLEMTAALRRPGWSPNLLVLELENATPRRVAPESVQAAAEEVLDEDVELVSGKRRAAALETVQVHWADDRLTARTREVGRFYGADLIVASRLSGGAVDPENTESDVGRRYRYRLQLKAFDCDSGDVVWQGERSWEVSW